MIPNGLKPLSLTDHEQNEPYRVGSLINLTLEGVPDKWEAEVPSNWVFNQGAIEPSNDECGGCALALSVAIREKKQIDPHFHWMIARLNEGADLNDYGVTNRSLANASRKVGSLLAKDSPYSFQNGRDFIADSTNWDIAKLKPKATEQLSGGVTWVKKEGGLDAFDVFRASVWKFNKLYKKDHTAIFGLMWNYDMFNPYIEKPVEEGSGHDTLLIGWDGDYAIMMNSYGLEVGNGGKFKVHRSVINRWAEEFGMPILIDATKEQIDQALARGSKLDDPFLTNFTKAIMEKIIALFNLLKGKEIGGIKVMLWDTPEHIRRNVRVMCDEAGLSFATKNIICAIIKQESNWNPKIVSKPNTNNTRDWGLLQINDNKGYWIGERLYFASTDEVLNNPEKSVRFIIEQAKKGKLWLWSSYKFGHYKKHLLSESRPSIPY